MYEPEYNSTGPQSNLPQPQQLNGAQAESGGVNLLIRLNFKYILKLLLLWFLPITILSLVAGLSSFFVITKYKEKVYTSNAILVRYQKMVGNESKIPYLYQETDINMLLETVKLRRNMLEVIDRLDLDVAPEALFQMITVQPGNRSDTVHISVVYSDPQICADIANTLGEVFAENYTKIFNSSVTKVLEEYVAQREKVQEDLRKAEAEMLNFSEVNDVTFADKELEIKLQEINSLEMMLREATINEQALTIRIGESKKRMESLPDIVQASQTVQARRGKEIQLMQRELDITLQRYTKENPKVKEMMLKLEQLKKIDAEQGDEPILPDTQTYSANVIKQTVETELANMESERLALLCKIENYNNQIEMAKLDLAKLTSMQEGYLDAKHNLNVARELFKMIDQRIVEARMAMDATAYDIDFLERAEPALQPESTGRKILAVLSTFGMAFIGVAFVLAYAIFSPGVKVPGDLDSMDAVEFIGVLPRKKNSTLTTYFSTLQIVVNRIDSRLSEVGPTMVTFASVKSGEGKTTIMDDITDMKSVTGKKILILKRVLEPDVNRSIQVPTNSIINFQDFREENMNVPEPVKINDKTSRLYYIVGNNISKLNILPEVVVNFKNKYSEFDYIFIELFSPKRNYQVSGCIMQSAHYNILVTKYGANTVSAIDKITKLAVSNSTNKVGTVINFGDLNLS